MILKKLREFQVKVKNDKLYIIDTYYNFTNIIKSDLIENNLNNALNFIKIKYNIEEEEIVGVVNRESDKSIIVKSFKNK